MADDNPHRFTSGARRIWDALALAPYLPIAAYLGLFGVAGLVGPDHGILPDSVRDALPWWLATLWTIAVAVGGCGATIGGLLQHTRIESVGLAFLAIGAGIYGAVVASAIWPSGATVVAVSAAIVSMCLIRMRVLTLSRRAQETATRIRRRRDR